MKKLTNNKGFSLIELIIVIAIMAVLVAIIAPNLTKYLGSSKKQTDKKNMDEIKAQIKNCIADAETADPVIAVPSWTNQDLSTLGTSGFEGLVKTALDGSPLESKEKSGKKFLATITNTSGTYNVTITIAS